MSPISYRYTFIGQRTNILIHQTSDPLQPLSIKLNSIKYLIIHFFLNDVLVIGIEYYYTILIFMILSSLTVYYDGLMGNKDTSIDNDGGWGVNVSP